MRQFLLSMLLLAPLPFRTVHAEVFLAREEALRLASPEADLRQEQLTRFEDAERRAIAERTGSSEVPASLAWWRFTREGRTLGYACIDDVQGKSQPITFLLATDANLHVRSVEILAYRESHGGEVRRSDWRAQFVGKGPESPLRVGRDVRNIAGATISCRSLTNGVRVRLEQLRLAVARTPRPAEPPAASAPHPGEEARQSDPSLLQRCQLLMGTTLSISLDEAPSESSEQGLAAAFAEVRRLQELLSDWDSQSEVSVLNRAGTSERLAISPELAEILGLSLQLSTATEGAFDVSVGALTQLWRSARTRGELPAPSELERARLAVGAAGIEFDPLGPRARLSRAGMALDFGAIGKGYALDRAAAILRARGHTRALLDFGGQLLALDPPHGAAGWLVSLRDPRGPERAPLLEFRLAQASFATSSDDQQGATLEGRACSHICDPRSGALVEGRLAASVLAPSAAVADAWSTALYVLGPEGLPRAQTANLGALVLGADGKLQLNSALQSVLAGSRP